MILLKSARLLDMTCPDIKWCVHTIGKCKKMAGQNTFKNFLLNDRMWMTPVISYSRCYFADGQSIVAFNIFIRLLLNTVYKLDVTSWSFRTALSFQTTCFKVLYLFTPRCMYCWSFRFSLCMLHDTFIIIIMLSTLSTRVTSWS